MGWAEFEPVGLADMLTVVLEITVIGAALWNLRRRTEPAALSRLGYRFAISGIALAGVAVTAPGVLAAFDHSHARGEDHGGTQREGHHEANQRPRREPTASPTPQTRPDGTTRPHGGRGHTH